MKRRTFVLGSSALVSSSKAFAQTYPAHPVRVIVPFTPGGMMDNVSRLIGERMARELHQPLVIDNRAGANGRIGTDAVAKAVPDGYTLLAAAIGPLAINIHVSKAPYDAQRDFQPIMLIATNDVVVVINPKLPITTVAEFIAYAKSSTAKMKYGSAGIGSAPHLTGELLKRAIGADMVHVPYKGDSAAIADVVNGTVDFSISTVAATIGLLRGGSLRAIASTGSVRSQVLPDVPTLDESGLKGFYAETWIGLCAPAKTPTSVIDRLYEAARLSLADPELRQKLIAGGNNIVGSTPQEFGAFLAAENAKWGEVVRAANVRLDE